MAKAPDHDEHRFVAEPLWGGWVRGALVMLAFGVPLWAMLAMAVRVSQPLSVLLLLGFHQDEFTETVRTLQAGEVIETTRYLLSEPTLLGLSAIYALPPVLVAMFAVLLIGAVWRWSIMAMEGRAARKSRRSWDAATDGDADLHEQSWSHNLPEPDREPPATE